MRTPKNIRLELVYSDPDFQRDAKAIHDRFTEELIVGNRPIGYIDGVKQGNVRSAGINKYASSDLNDDYRNLRERYELSAAEFTNFFTRNEVMEEDGLNTIEQDSPVVIQLPSPDDTMLTIQIHPNATLKDIETHWSAIKEVLDYNFNKSERLRGPKNEILLWAVHKAKMNGKSYKKIAEEVTSNTLPQYEQQKGEKKNWSESEIRQYYYTYKMYVNKYPR